MTITYLGAQRFLDRSHLGLSEICNLRVLKKTSPDDSVDPSASAGCGPGLSAKPSSPLGLRTLRECECPRGLGRYKRVLDMWYIVYSL